MRQLNDFTCAACGDTKEYFVDSTTDTVRCECGGEATKSLTSINVKFNPFAKNATTKAVLKWSKDRDRKLKKERKASWSE